MTRGKEGRGERSTQLVADSGQKSILGVTGLPRDFRIALRLSTPPLSYQTCQLERQVRGLIDDHRRKRLALVIRRTLAIQVTGHRSAILRLEPDFALDRPASAAASA